MSKSPHKALDLDGQESKGQAEEWTEEKYIPKKGYNQQQKYEEFQDDRREQYREQPFRYLNNWFLADSRSVNLTRFSLPRNQNKFSMYVCLYGDLEPRNNVPCSTKEAKVMRVVIRRLKYWTMDWAHSTRGIWVFTGNWYKLKSPDDTEILLPDMRRVSMMKVHLEMRAIFGLFSNVADMLMELKEEQKEDKYGQKVKIPMSYLSTFHRTNTPEQSHAALCPSQEQIDMHPKLNSEPFDLDLLRRESKIIRFNLRNLDKKLTICAPFMRGLCRMDEAFHDAEKRAEHWAMMPYDYLVSARESEARSQQTPWGDRTNHSSCTCFCLFARQRLN
mmetsp:Transcript_9574/g.28729  ORF Transcript_9574/g.28729 Transcript_9574/m.28729 type:complete len:332 (-) Transcript_9574:1173-2168(-)